MSKLSPAELGRSPRPQAPGEAQQTPVKEARSSCMYSLFLKWFKLRLSYLPLKSVLNYIFCFAFFFFLSSVSVPQRSHPPFHGGHMLQYLESCLIFFLTLISAFPFALWNYLRIVQTVCFFWWEKKKGILYVYRYQFSFFPTPTIPLRLLS